MKRWTSWGLLFCPPWYCFHQIMPIHPPMLIWSWSYSKTQTKWPFPTCPKSYHAVECPALGRQARLMANVLQFLRLSPPSQGGLAVPGSACFWPSASSPRSRQCSPSPAPTLTASRTSFCPTGWDVGRWGENLLSYAQISFHEAHECPCSSIWFYICTSTYELIFKISSAHFNPFARSLVEE